MMNLGEKITEDECVSLVEVRGNEILDEKQQLRQILYFRKQILMVITNLQDIIQNARIQPLHVYT